MILLYVLFLVKVLLYQLKDKIIIHEADIGHVKPTFTIINGSYVTIDYSNSTFKLETELKVE